MSERCEYCGTPLLAQYNDPYEEVDGRLHTTKGCREYVYAALQAYRKENAKLRAKAVTAVECLRDLEQEVARTCGPPGGQQVGPANVMNIGNRARDEITNCLRAIVEVLESKP